ncbi:hypothetical protein EV122DRAFT_278370 [Schizophyllum commune]
MLQAALDLSLYGVQVALSIAAIAILARREGRSRWTLTAILGIILSSSIIVVASYAFDLIQIPVAVGTSKSSIDDVLLRLNILGRAARSSIYVLSDAVLVWRAWCLWPDSHLFKSILSLCMCGSVAGCIAECIWLYWPDSPTLSSFESHIKYLTRFIPLFATNVVATAMIGVWVCRYRREIKGSLGALTQKTRSERVLMLLLESGSLYCVFWVYICITFFIAKDDGYSAIDAFGAAGYHISGIYPTCVLFVSMQDSSGRSLLSNQVSQAMHFASTPEAQEGPRGAGVTSDSPAGRIDSAYDAGPQDSHVGNSPCSSVAQGCAEAPLPDLDQGVFEKLEGESATV